MNYTINTMTLLFKTNIDKIDLKDFAKCVEDMKQFKCYSINVSTTKTFNNSVIVKLRNEEASKRNKSIKLFPNGVLHLTGCKSADEGRDLLCDFILDVERQSLIPLGTICITDDVQIQMINSSMHFGKAIDLDRLYKHIINQNVVICKLLSISYNKEHHPAINIKIKANDASSKGTILIFGSGSVIITGVKSIGDLDIYHDISIKSFAKYFDENGVTRIKHPDVKKKRGRKPKHITTQFYDELRKQLGDSVHLKPTTI